jgi:hypothetical protein
MQAETSFQKTPVVLRVPSGSASSPSSRYWYRLRVARRSWRGSKLRTEVEECCNFPLRIGAILTAPHPHNVVQLGSPHPAVMVGKIPVQSICFNTLAVIMCDSYHMELVG